VRSSPRGSWPAPSPPRFDATVDVVLVGESYSGSLIAFAEEKSSDLIVVGGARDGFFGGPFVLTLTSATGAAIRMLSLVSSESPGQVECSKDLRQVQIEAAEANLLVAARALPEAPEIESLVADGTTLESALRKLNWDDVDVPMIVIPREE
jgi:hypothetical protein